jgi:hypothetical protein
MSEDRAAYIETLKRRHITILNRLEPHSRLRGLSNAA